MVPYDVSSYEPGAGYDTNPDSGANPGGEQPAAAPAPSGAGESAAPAASKADSDRYAWMKAQGEKRAAAAPAPAAKETPTEEPAVEEPAAEEAPQQIESFELRVPEFIDTREITPERQSYVAEFQALAP